jgi:hypothetical protein
MIHTPSLLAAFAGASSRPRAPGPVYFNLFRLEVARDRVLLWMGLKCTNAPVPDSGCDIAGLPYRYPPPQMSFFVLFSQQRTKLGPAACEDATHDVHEGGQVPWLVKES